MKKVCRKHRNTNCLACKGGSLFASDDPAVWMEVEDSWVHSSEGNYVSYAGDSGSSESSASSTSYDSGSSSSSSSYDSGSSW